MPAAAARRCAVPECPNLVTDRGAHRCAEHTVQQWRAINAARTMPRHRGARWVAVRAAFLRRHPRCVDCGAPATVADHAPVSRRDLIAQGVHDPDDERYLQARCGPCHGRATASREGIFGRSPTTRARATGRAARRAVVPGAGGPPG
jgi:5-methylcytosine-specific restriction protein A